MYTTLTPNLMTENVNESVAFYRDRLGFDFFIGVAYESETPINAFTDDVALQWAMLGRGAAKLMFQARDSLADEFPPLKNVPLAASATFYIEVENLDDLLAGLGNEVERVLPERVTFYGMREVWIRDNNGYIVTLAQKCVPA